MPGPKVISLFPVDGSPDVLQYVHDDEVAEILTGLGDLVGTHRASNVEPHPTMLGKWTADMSPTTGCLLDILGPFDTRTEALEAERKYLELFMALGLQKRSHEQ